MSRSDHIKQKVVQEFFCQKGLILLENDKTGFFCRNYVSISESRQRGTLF